MCFIRDLDLDSLRWIRSWFFSIRKFVLFFSIHFNFFFSSCCYHHSVETFQTMINKFGYVVTRMFIFSTNLFHYQIVLCSSISIEFFWFEFFANELSENSLTYRNSPFFSCVLLRRRFYDGIIFEIRCHVAEIVDVDQMDFDYDTAANELWNVNMLSCSNTLTRWITSANCFS